MSSTRAINILLVDDHPLVLEGIRAIIETYSHIEVVGAAASVSEALAIAARTEPEVLLMDINMNEINGLDAIELFKEKHPRIRILMLSMHDNREYISTSVMYGAAGYVLKDVPANEIISAIETVAAGGTYFSSGVSNALMSEKNLPGSTNPLTEREKSVLALVAEGKSSKDAGKLLSISTRTIETHRKNIKKKLAIGTTAGLTRYAIENGIITTD
ncbi:MAG: response regulator transcription factor [Devosiaceae bacterium]|nr:response regulator transcription factor [Devosiaceae bacterium]